MKRKLPKPHAAVLAWIKAYKEYLAVEERTKNRKQRKAAWDAAEELRKKANIALKIKEKPDLSIFGRLKKIHPDLQHIRWDGCEAEMRFGNAVGRTEPWAAAEFQPDSETYHLLADLEEILRKQAK